MGIRSILATFDDVSDPERRDARGPFSSESSCVFSYRMINSDPAGHASPCGKWRVSEPQPCPILRGQGPGASDILDPINAHTFDLGRRNSAEQT